MIKNINFSNSFINNPVKYISNPAYTKAKRTLDREHAVLHFFLHNLYCRLSPLWQAIPYANFVRRTLLNNQIDPSHPDIT